MAIAITDIRKLRGRPATGSTGVMVKLSPAQLAAIDAWSHEQADALSRPEAIRRLVAKGLRRVD
jgi:hypothetical protein